jgi:hypothetical protein
MAHHGNPVLAMKALASGGVTICHNPGTPSQQTMVVKLSALSGHLGHGDVIGSCGGWGEVDGDLDGYKVCQGDCDDTDPAVNPGMTEIPGNGKDDDCDPTTIDSSTDQAHIDFINDLTNTTKQVYNYLIAASPLSDAVYMAMLNRVQPLNSNDNYWILAANSPLSEGVLNTLVNKEGIMSSVNYGWILVNNSPLTSSILDQICAGSPSPATMSDNDRDWVLSVNSYTCP